MRLGRNKYLSPYGRDDAAKQGVTAMPALYTGKALIKNGRDGQVRSDDGRLDAKLAFPTAMGGTGAGTNPEQLFAAGYGACFAATLVTIGKAQGKTLHGVEVAAEVDVLLEDGTYDLAVRFAVKAAGVDERALQGLIDAAELACPYARAVRNNVRTTIRIAKEVAQ